MTFVEPVTGGPSLITLIPSEPRTLSEIKETLRLSLSKADMKHFQALEAVFLNPHLRFDSEEYLLSLRVAFASPLYSDSSKIFFAATYANNDSILLCGDRFLTEEMILSNIEEPSQFLSGLYLAAVMSSLHLSERIVEATLKKLSSSGGRYVLKIAPDTMITPKTICQWRSKAGKGFQISSIALRIRLAHPEYQGFPDDWVLKVFCGD